MVEQVRYGLVGTGMMGVEHLNNLAVTPGAVVTAIADPVATSLGWARAATPARRLTGVGFSPAAGAPVITAAAAVAVALADSRHRGRHHPLLGARLLQ